MKLHEHLKQARKDAGLSHQELADKAQMRVGLVISAEEGYEGSDVYKDICKALGINYMKLLQDIDPMAYNIEINKRKAKDLAVARAKANTKMIEKVRKR